MNTRPLPSDFLPLTATRRQRIERTIDALIAMLDQADGDADLEPILGASERHPDATGRTPGRSGFHHYDRSGSQANWCRATGLLDECEDENEHGGDALDGAGGPEWSNDPEAPQEGHGWHFHDNGGAVHRNPIGTSA